MLFAAPASAFHCPLDAKAEAQKMRDEGKALHQAGDHKGSVDKFSAAMRVILSGM